MISFKIDAKWIGLVLILAAAAMKAEANPSGSTVTAGAATVTSAGSTVTINQTTDRAIINWQNFSIGAGETVNFNQLATTSATLNRVTGGSISSIYGNLNANGQIFLINPAGIVIGSTGVIHAASFIASTRDLVNSDSEFMAGAAGTTWKFSGTGLGDVQNLGTIQASLGDVALFGAHVSNGGIILAPSGTAHLAAGNVIYYTPSATSSGNVPGTTYLAVDPVTGTASADYGVTNTGTVTAAAAELAAAGGNVYALAINNGGTIRATGTTTVDGHVYLAGNGGQIENTGTLVSRKADGSGGVVTVSSPGGSFSSPGQIDVNGTTTGTVMLMTENSTTSGTLTFGLGVTGAGISFGSVSSILGGATLSLNSSSGYSGVYTYFGGATLSFAGGPSFSILPGLTLTVAGQVISNGGIFTLGGKTYQLTSTGVVSYSPASAATPSTMALAQSVISSGQLHLTTAPGQALPPMAAGGGAGDLTVSGVRSGGVVEGGSYVNVAQNVVLIPSPLAFQNVQGGTLTFGNAGGGVLASGSSFSLPPNPGQ